MRRKRLFWHLYPWFILLTFVSVVGVGWYISAFFREHYFENIRESLRVRAELIEGRVSELLHGVEKRGQLTDFCSTAASLSGARITVILPSGEVVYDSDEDSAKMEDHFDRPEYIDALGGKTGESIRYSRTLKQNFMYVAIPLLEQNQVVGALRLSMPLASVERKLGNMYRKIFWGGFMGVLLAALLSFIISRRISRPLEELGRGFEYFADDRLDHRLNIVEGPAEVRRLAEIANEMAGKLQDRIQTVLRQRDDRNSVFYSLAEGVIAVDADERIIDINRAAARMLDVDSEEVKGKTIYEIIRKPDLQDFISRSLSSSQPTEGKVVFYQEDSERYYKVRGTELMDSSGEVRGAVVVLNDITRMKRLENMRRDFVANVSHELKTPVTSIKGFAETLLEGGVDSGDAERFLKIITRQADRMNAMIEDLLLLSRLDQDEGVKELELIQMNIRKIIVGAMESRRSMAEEKKISLQLDCPEEVFANVKGDLLEQAFVNLIDNAVKYSESGSSVEINVNETGEDVWIDVVDHGCGIEAEHLPRIFERFYRVDKARSRNLGGTGLGLAIVKHIIRIHGGEVEVESEPGEGSVFSVILPGQS
jgi:two-component system phosphate regulon sensor histidine kinase PhoR